MRDKQEEPGQPAAPANRPRHDGPTVTIHTDFPDRLPVLPGEVALIRSYLGELVARLTMNDNGDEP